MKPASRSPYGWVDPRPVVFFDGGCPLCRREIAHYRRRDGAGCIRWVDAARESDALAGYGLSREHAMAELHVLDQAGHWRRGVDAFLLIWDHLPAYRRLAWLVRALRLRAPLGLIYRRFASWRMQRRCRQGACMMAGGVQGR